MPFKVLTRSLKTLSYVGSYKKIRDRPHRYCVYITVLFMYLFPKRRIVPFVRISGYLYTMILERVVCDK